MEFVSSFQFSPGPLFFRVVAEATNPKLKNYNIDINYSCRQNLTDMSLFWNQFNFTNINQCYCT